MIPGTVLRLLSQEGRHPKLDKNRKVGVLGLVMHLAPADRSGYEVCPGRSSGCTAACLNTAGFRYERKETARINRTKYFFEQREAFMEMLVREIRNAQRRARKKGYICGIRLNGTSDIPWEKIPVKLEHHQWPNIMEVFPEIPFMDYTKRSNRRNLPPNYRILFSRSEDNEAKCVAALENGLNVAVVFRAYKDEPLPARWSLGKWHNIRVIDGDVHDWRYGDYDQYTNERVIVGLRAKGRAGRTDASGFVLDFPRTRQQHAIFERRRALADYQIERKHALAAV